MQVEICPETGRRHLQAAVQLTRPVAFPEALALMRDLLGRTTEGTCAGRLVTREVGEGATNSWPRLVNYVTKGATRDPAGFQLRCTGDGSVEIARGPDQFTGWTRDSGATPGRERGGDTGERRRATREEGCGGGGKAEDALEAALALIEDGLTPFQACKRLRMLTKYHAVKELAAGMAAEMIPEDREVAIEYHYGVPGAGKSTAIRKKYPGAFWKLATRDARWWCGYSNQKVLVIDDIRPSNFPDVLLLRVCDGNPLTVEYKGGSVQACWTRVVITSNLSPAELVMRFDPDVQEPLRARLCGRRCTVQHWPTEWVPPPPEPMAVECSDGESVTEIFSRGATAASP